MISNGNGKDKETDYIWVTRTLQTLIVTTQITMTINRAITMKKTNTYVKVTVMQRSYLSQAALV